MKYITFSIGLLFLVTCTDNKPYKEARNIAITQYALSCTGGTIYSCKSSCDGKCGIDSSSLTSIKLDCAKVCTDDCNRNCNSILLFLFNTKE